MDAGGSRSGIFVIGVDGEGLARLTLERAISLAWSPDGKTIAYVHRRGHVGLLDVASRRSRRLPVRGLEAPSAVDWSPRGRFLAIADRDELQLVRVGGERVRKLVEGRSPEQVSWSPDGCCLAFSAERKGERSGQLDLYLVSVRGGRARRLTASPGYDLDPDWRP